jgi:predicted TIM-barrel fold metal-dependent hydrolase
MLNPMIEDFLVRAHGKRRKGSRTRRAAKAVKCPARSQRALDDAGELLHSPTTMRPTFSLLAFTLGLISSAHAADDVAAVRAEAARWRAEHRIIDLHMHIEAKEERYERAVRIMDAAGLGLGVNLSGGTVTPGTNGAPSAFAQHKALADHVAPGRFLLYFNLDYKGWDDADWSARAVKQVEEAHRLGAAGLKEYKRLGLYLRDGQANLIKIDDPKLDPVWKRCGELGLPVSIHVADPKAFWLPFNERNERWAELKDHKNWWFGDPNVFPPRLDLINALDRVIAKHRGTTFVCVHFANNPEDIEWVDAALTRNPNMMADLAARVPEVGRHDPKKVHDLFVKHQDRIVFATDFMVYDRLILGSSGDDERPTDADAQVFYEKNWRWLETWDKDWPHMTPIQGSWTISSIGLPASVLRKIYFDNALKLLARSMPKPVAKAKRISDEPTLDGVLDEAAWQTARPAQVEYASVNYAARPDMATSVRVLWTDTHLYFGWECPFTELTVFSPVNTKDERIGLWEKDVVEMFIGPDLGKVTRYGEYEVSPSNEWVDLLCDLPDKDFAWNGGLESAVKVDEARKVFTVELRLRIDKLTEKIPTTGTRWWLNLYRIDRANNAFLAFSPVLTGSFHTPQKFGLLEFE